MKQKNVAILIGLVSIVAVGGLVWVSLDRSSGELTPTEVEAKKNPYSIPGFPELVAREDLGLQFKYYGGPDGYSLIESLPGQFADADLLQTFILVRTGRYIEMQSGVLDETPPAMSVMVFQKPEEPAPAEGAPEDTRSAEQVLKDWASSKATLTNIDRAQGEPTMTSIDNIDALTYRADGLYPSDVFIVKRKKNYYVFSGQFTEAEDDIDQAFSALMESVRFE